MKQTKSIQKTTPRKSKIKRKVVCIFGKWGKKTDFVLEPVCSDECNCEVCKDAFWIEKCEEEKE